MIIRKNTDLIWIATVGRAFRFSAHMHHNWFVVFLATVIQAMHGVAVHVEALYMSVQLHPAQSEIECLLENFLGIVLTGFGFLVFWTATKELPVAVVSTLMHIEPASAVVLAMIFPVPYSGWVTIIP